MVQLATRVDDAVGETFKSLTKQLGTTPADAMRMFVMAFNAKLSISSIAPRRS